MERLMSEYSFPQIGHLWGVYEAILGIVTIGAPTYGFLDQGANWYIHCMCYPHLSSWAQGYFSYIHHHYPNHLMQRPFGTYTPMSLHNQISLKRVQGLVGGNAIVTNVCVGLGIFQACIEPSVLVNLVVFAWWTHRRWVTNGSYNWWNSLFN